ncbi:MAG TPA: YbaB/EbfC family nucleoid-associated protein [Planctomycetaceae bacterium]|nr:YbaB/EbfC family nucleoid-associated protein [Planctomycetaceae bacterium]
MLKGLGQFASLLKNAGEIQGRMQEMQENLKRVKVDGSAGGGMVTVEMNGQQQVLSCRIEESLFASGDREMVEDLIVSACNQALEKVRETAAMEMNKFAGGFDVPGLGEALARFGGNGGP